MAFIFLASAIKPRTAFARSPRLVRVGGYGEALLRTERNNVRFLGSHGDNRFARCEDSVHLAGYNHAFQATL